LSSYELSARRLKEAIEREPNHICLAARKTPGGREHQELRKYVLRAAYDRGVFCVNGSNQILLARGERTRMGDRLTLRWQSADRSLNCRMFEVCGEIDAASDGFSAVKLVPYPRKEQGKRAQSDQPMQELLTLGTEGTWQLAIPPLDDIEVLESWKRQVSSMTRQAKPPLVIVTVSGGGIRASVWTETVLEELERQLNGRFPYHIRLVTGASGGMVAAAHFVTSLPQPSGADLPPGHRDCDILSGQGLAEDQLNAVAGVMVFNDAPGLLNPIQRTMDRGRKLEENWCMLAPGHDAQGRTEESPLSRPLRSYAADELAGWRPSLVFTPMMVEDGRRLLISNLDLSFAARNRARLLLERDSRLIDPTYREELGKSFIEDDDLLSVSAIEFFRLFPRAWNFKVSTAARMSASFPMISPAASLPTLPPRRAVDASYYDNYGVNLAAQWLIELRWWLEKNTSGVLIIQIRDSISQQARTQLDFDRRSDPEVGFLERITWGAGQALLVPGFYPTNTPIQGMSSARQWSMSFRNDEQVELFDQLLRHESVSPREFFRTVVFECPIPASLSWTLSEREKRMIRLGLGVGSGVKEVPLAKIRDFRKENHFRMDLLEEAIRCNQCAPGETLEETYRRKSKELYDGELAKLGFEDLKRMSSQESKELYTNVINNRSRVELLVSWWKEHTE
jgi:hypothetical protein